jgi:hypothetical protein
MNAVYPAALDAFLAGAVDVTTDALRVQPVTAGYVYDASHQWLTSVAGGNRVTTPQTLTGVDATGGRVTVDPVTFPAVPAGATITGIVVYADGASDAARRLLAYIDRRSDTVPIDVTTNGADITLSFTVLLKI